jgi:TonB family protein
VPWTTHVISFLLILAAGMAFPPLALAADEASWTGTAEVRVAKPGMQLKRTRFKAPVYPQWALRAQLSGFVSIEFVVNANGEPIGLRVIDASPAKVFESSVLRAVKTWRYQPRVINNVPAETPTRMIVLFKTHS